MRYTAANGARVAALRATVDPHAYARSANGRRIERQATDAMRIVARQENDLARPELDRRIRIGLQKQAPGYDAPRTRGD